MHCIEPVPNNYEAIKNASSTMGFDNNKFVVSHAAISSSDGSVQFPNGAGGSEAFGIDSCAKGGSNCISVPLYSLDSYTNQFVSSKGEL